MLKKIFIFTILFILCITAEAAEYPITYTVTASSLNVRFNAGTQYDIFIP